MKKAFFPLFLFLSSINLLLLSNATATSLPDGYIISKETVSPSHRYGFMVPVFDTLYNNDTVYNALVNRKTGQVITKVNADTAFDHRLNHTGLVPPWWSEDESLVLWKVTGKGAPSALVLIKLQNGTQAWQLNLLTAFQKEILSRTRAAAPEKYEAAKKSHIGNGAAYPDGFTVDVEPNIKSDAKLKLPLEIHVSLTSNPKQIEDIPNLDAEMNGVVKEDGSIEIKQFQLLPL